MEKVCDAVSEKLMILVIPLYCTQRYILDSEQRGSLLVLQRFIFKLSSISR